MKKIYELTFVLIAILSLATSAYALESKYIYRENGLAAFASWSNDIPGGFVYKDLYVTKTNDATDIYISICTFIGKKYKCKSGYKYTTEKVIDMDTKLNSATLSPVEIDLYDWNWNKETVTLQAEWTGTGDITKDSFKFMTKSGDYISKYSAGSSLRNAVATASINEETFGTSEYGGLVAFKYASMTIVK